jgi:hypothetical protein
VSPELRHFRGLDLLGILCPSGCLAPKLYRRHLIFQQGCFGHSTTGLNHPMARWIPAISLERGEITTYGFVGQVLALRYDPTGAYLGILKSESYACEPYPRNLFAVKITHSLLANDLCIIYNRSLPLHSKKTAVIAVSL